MTFTFKDIPSKKMGIKIIGMSGAQRAPCKPEIVSIPGRYEPLILEKHESQTTEITVELLVENPDNIRQIFSWLSGKGKLIFSDEPDKYYNVLSDDIISLQRIDNRIQSFDMKFVCEPFAYSVYNPLEQMELTLNNEKLSRRTSIYLNGTADSEPLFVAKFAGVLNLTVNGDTLTINTPFTYKIEDGKYIYTYELQEIYVDSATKMAYVITESGEKQVVTCQTAGRFPVLHHEDNEIIIEISPDREDVTSNHRLEKFRYRKNERWH